MKLRLMAGAAALALIAGGISMGALAETKPAKASASAGKPTLGAWGVDLAGMDKAATPGNDFYRYVNGAGPTKPRFRRIVPAGAALPSCAICPTSGPA